MNGESIDAYFIPRQATFTTKSITLDSLSGDLVWDAPRKMGEYNYAIEISEWRKINGKVYRIGYIVRDMQVDIGACNNTPPVIAPLFDYCVVAGDKLELTISASDPDGDKVLLTAKGGPLDVVQNPATFSSPGFPIENPSGIFTWNTVCSHIRKQPYQVAIKAEDDGTGPPNNSYPPVTLTDIQSFRINVIPPKPPAPILQAQNKAVQVNWGKNPCPQATGYLLYRRVGSYAYSPNPCVTGLPGYTGYKLIATIKDPNTTSYFDNDKGAGLPGGVSYCYRIVSTFPEDLESYPSEENCVELKRSEPLLTQASILTTDSMHGEVRVRWQKPLAADFDTIVHSGPYQVVLSRTEGYLPAGLTTSIFSANYTYFKSIPDSTIVLDKVDTLNTRDKVYNYEVHLMYSGGNEAVSRSASTTRLFLKSEDKRLRLSWKVDALWVSDTVYVYRESSTVAGVFNLIGSTSSGSYLDQGLQNGLNYCYFISDQATLSGTGIPRPIFNRSQIICESPLDLTPPCAPSFTLTGKCKSSELTFEWELTDDSCKSDVAQYRIYYRPSQSLAWSTSPLASVVYPTSEYIITNDGSKELGGCYAVAAVDVAGNESTKSNEHCIDYCSDFAFPNVFSPNGDDVNDYFEPFNSSKALSAKTKIFNRWGQLMYETSDKRVRWDGRNSRNGKDCAESVYYYICEVELYTVMGIEKRNLTGFIQLIRGNSTNPPSEH